MCSAFGIGAHFFNSLDDRLRTSAPTLPSACTTSAVWPLSAATLPGVRPSLVACFTSAPTSVKARTCVRAVMRRWSYHRADGGAGDE
eukprot:1187435-Prorocentrum_minimum.AAC.8